MSLSSLVQANDGNYYGVTAPSGQDLYCVNQSNVRCGGLYGVTPAGKVTSLVTFPSGTKAPQGYDPQPLVIGPDGNMYGVTTGGGASANTATCYGVGCGVLFQLTTKGEFQIIHNFTDGEIGSSVQSSDAFSAGAPVLGSDEYFYQSALGRSGIGLIFKISPAGNFKLLHVFSSAAASDGFQPNPLVQGADGNFYGTTFSHEALPGYYSAISGTIFRMTPDGVITTLATFPADNSLGLNPGGLVQGPDGTFYGLTRGSSTTSVVSLPTVFRFTPAGKLETMYTFPPTSGFLPIAPLIFGSDGNLYGMAPDGGDATFCTGFGQKGCGTIFQITPAGAFKVVHTFNGDRSGAFPGGKAFYGGIGTESYQGGEITQGSDGKILVTTGTTTGGSSATSTNDSTLGGAVYSLDLGLPAPVQLTFTRADGTVVTTTSTPNTPLTLSWLVPGAFSTSASLCYASVQGNSPDAGAWSGLVKGTTDATGFHGSTQITPKANGTYTYVLTCGGRISGFATLNLSSSLSVVTTSLPHGTVSKAYSVGIAAVGGTNPYKWAGSGFPPGLAIDPASGFINGTPTQFGTFQVTVAVQDSSTPALTTGTTFSLVIDSSLMLSGTLNNAIVGSKYTGGLKVVGGYGTYKWTLASGTLPEGLTLNATTGVISGTPTKSGKATFSITVSDGENPAATATQAASISTEAPPLTVVGGDFVDCTVGVVCTNEFEASGGTPPYTWTVAPGATLPAGMTLHSDGSFSFKPIQFYAASYTLEVQVTDSSTPPLMATGSNGLLITSSLKANPYSLPVATVGLPYTAPAPTATGGLPPYAWVITPFNPQLKFEYGAGTDGALHSPGPKTSGNFMLTYEVHDSETNQAVASFVANLTVVDPPLATTTTLSVSNSTASSGMNVTLTARVGKSTGVPTGRVTFYSGTTALGIASLDATGTASITTAFTSAGTYSLTAQYSGDGTSAGSVSAPILETVVTPALAASITPSTLTVTSGASGTLAITLTATGGYTGVATFSCGTLPAHITCSFAPPAITLSSSVTTGTSTLTISTGQTTAASNAGPRLPGETKPVVEWAGTLGLISLCFARRSRSLLRLRITTLALLGVGFFLALGITGCAGESPNAAPGTYAVPISVSVGGVVQVVDAKVIVN